MKKLLLILGTMLFSHCSYSATQAECEEFLCLPVAFAESGCSDAKHAFLHRIKHFKSPLPNYNDCKYKGDDAPVDNTVLSEKDGYSAYIKAGDYCTEKAVSRRTQETFCIAHIHIAKTKYVDDTRCNISRVKTQDNKIFIHSEPLGCVKTVRYTQELQDGTPIGDKYYY